MLETPTVAELGPPTPALPVPSEVEVPVCRPGSHYDAKVLRSKIQGLLAQLDRADETLRSLCQTAREKQIHLMLEGPSGAYFRDWTEFVSAPLPWGLAMRPDLIEQLVREHRDPQRGARLVLEGPQLLQTRNAPRKGRAAGPASARGIDYSLQRLKRDRPDLLERVASGDLTIQAAAEQAGHRPALTAVLVEPQSIARLVVSRLEDAQQRELIDLVQHPEQITDPGHGTNAHWDAYRARTTPPDVLAQQRAQAKAAKAAQRQAYEVAYRQQRNAARAAQRAQAQALGLPSMAMDVEAAG